MHTYAYTGGSSPWAPPADSVVVRSTYRHSRQQCMMVLVVYVGMILVYTPEVSYQYFEVNMYVPVCLLAALQVFSE